MFHNKTVKVRDSSILAALAPYYRMTDELEPYSIGGRILYTGRNIPNLRSRLEREYESYILVSRVGEIDISTKEKLVDFVYSRFDREPPKKVKEICTNLDEREVESLMKITWNTGKFPIKGVEGELSIYDLYKALPGPQRNLIETYIKVIEQMPVYIVESSLLTMLLRVKDIENQDVSPHYLKLLRQISMRVGDKIEPVMRRYAKRNTLAEANLLCALLELRGG